mgnify:CR=1 FL=1
MSPVAAIEKLLTVNRDAAVLILTGIAVFTAISIVGAYKINLDTALGVAAYIFGFGVAATVFSIVIADLRIRAVMGWFLVVLIVGWTVVLSISILFQPGPFRPVYCILSFTERCEDVAERLALAEQKRSAVVVEMVPASLPVTPTGGIVLDAVPSTVRPMNVDFSTTIATASASVAVATPEVFVQFAGVITRDSVRELMRTLRAQGWNMQGVEAGGKRTEAAAGYNEVRYSPGEQAEAERLAEALQRLNPTGKPIIAVDNAAVAAGALEVWLSIV